MRITSPKGRERFFDMLAYSVCCTGMAADDPAVSVQRASQSQTQHNVSQICNTPWPIIACRANLCESLT